MQGLLLGLSLKKEEKRAKRMQAEATMMHRSSGSQSHRGNKAAKPFTTAPSRSKPGSVTKAASRIRSI